jgi:hypothetical protein
MKLKNILKSDLLLELNQIIFKAAFLSFILAVIFEYFAPGFVMNWFNPIWLLLVSIINVILAVLKDNIT